MYIYIYIYLSYYPIVKLWRVSRVNRVNHQTHRNDPSSHSPSPSSLGSSAAAPRSWAKRSFLGAKRKVSGYIPWIIMTSCSENELPLCITLHHFSTSKPRKGIHRYPAAQKHEKNSESPLFSILFWYRPLTKAQFVLIQVHLHIILPTLGLRGSQINLHGDATTRRAVAVAPAEPMAAATALLLQNSKTVSNL